jgi:hypothetical protein
MKPWLKVQSSSTFLVRLGPGSEHHSYPLADP